MKFYALKNSVLRTLFLLALSIPLADAEQATQPSLEMVFELELPDEAPVAFQSLAQMDELVQLGMPALALRLLSQEQQNWPVYSSEWYAFERKRITLLSALEDWQALIERTDALLHGADSAQRISIHITRWFSTQQVIARLRLGQAEQALAQLRTLLWHSSYANSDLNYSDMVALWRRLVIRAYLAMNADHDAQKALLRYQYDYSRNHRNLNMDWRLLQARSLLRTGRAEETMTLLADSPSHNAQALRLLAGLRAHPNKAGQYVQQAQVSLGQEKMNTGEIWAYRYVLYQAYLSQKKLSAATEVLKDLLVQREAHAFMGEEFNVSSDNLWQLYQSIGRQLGNRSKLLLGDDLAWYKKAGELQKKNQSVEALSLYAVLAFNARDIEKKQAAHKEIVALLEKDKNGLELVNQLYLHATKIASLKSLPLEVRYSLLDYALSKSDMKLAVRLLQSVQQPPQGQEVFAWEMRKARVMILEGAYAQGEAVLATTVKQTEQISPAQLDQFLQVIFDLQAVGRHVQVLALLSSLKPEWLDQTLHRELFFWKAESYAALEQYERAAWSYLKSAQLADETEAPLWAQSARFSAAGVLVKSGLYDDAQLIYNGLMPVTASDSRKAAIRQQLQHIRLLRNAEKTVLMCTEKVVINTPFTRMALMFEAGILRSVDFMAQQELCAPKSEQARKACQQIHDYCTKQLPDLAFDIELRAQGTSFQETVWQALRRIPAGQVLSYGELARQLNTSARAVGGACRANPVPLIIPCHRIVAKDGVGGFAGSTEGTLVNIKRRLLEHEGVL